MSVLPEDLSVHHVGAWGPQKSEEGPRSSGTGGIDGCKPPRGYWVSKWGPWEEQVLLSTEQSFQSLVDSL